MPFLTNIIRSNTIRDTPIRLMGIGFDFVVLSGANLIRKALTTSNNFDWNRLSARMFKNLFAAPNQVVAATLADNSGIGVRPYAGSNVNPDQRIIRNQVVFFSDAFSKTSMDEIVPRFVENLQRNCSNLNMGDEWVEMSDLFTFVRDIVFPSGVESFFGKSMLELNPNLQGDFWGFDENIPSLAAGLPAWLTPRATKYQKRCLASMKRWRQEAMREEGPVSSGDSPWDLAWGLGALRRRNAVLEATEGLFDEDARASMDLATLWA